MLFESFTHTLHPINCRVMCGYFFLDSMETNLSGSASWIDKLIGRDETHSPDDPCAEGMGDCAEVHDNASDFIDGEVATNLTSRIRHHLGFCGDCDGWMTSLAQTVGLVRQAPQQDVPDSLKESLKKITDE
jgi:hypothetical protein